MINLKRHDVSADVIRILAAFFIVLIHTTDRFVLYTNLKGSISWDIIYYINTLSRVAVPLFVILSGYLLLHKEKTQNIKSFYKKRILTIVPPFIFWICLHFLYSTNFEILTPQYILINLWNGTIWHLFFLIIILELYFFAPFIVRFMEKNNRKKQIILFWSLMALAIFSSFLNIFNIDLKKNSLTMFIPYIGIFYAGAFLRFIRLKKLMLFIALTTYLILPIITNAIADGDFGSFIVFNYSPTLLTMTICLFLVLKNIDQFFGKKLKSETFKKKLAFVSSTTFGIFFIHLIILDKVFSYFHLYPWQIEAPLVLNACLPAFITFIISFLIVVIIKKIPYGKYIIG